MQIFCIFLVLRTSSVIECIVSLQRIWKYNRKNILIQGYYGTGKFEFGDGYDRDCVCILSRCGAIMCLMSDKMKILFAYIKKKK